MNVNLSYSSKEVFLSISMFAVGFLYWDLIQIECMGAGVTVFFFTLTVLATVYLKQSGFKQTRNSIICNILIYVSALEFIIFDSGIEKLLNMLWLMFLFIYWIALFTERTMGKGISIYTLGDWVRQIVVTPFANFSSLFSILIFKNKDCKNGRKILSGLFGLLIFLPVLMIVITLLSSADDTFGNIFRSLFNLQFYCAPLYLREFVVGIPVAMYLCGLIMGNSQNSHATCKKENMDKLGEKLAFASNAAINTALAAFCVVYAIFIAVQLVNLFSSIGGGLPYDMTYAQYARKGFFQLCAVSGINLFLCAMTYAFVKDRTSKMFRGLVAFMSSATILLCTTAMTKMVLYINYYGLTQLRIYVSWFIILLTLIFAVVLIRQIRKFNSTRIIAIVFTVCFLVLIFGNVDGQIGKYNMARYEAGTLELMDDSTLSSLSYGAVPYICEAYENADDNNRRELCDAVTAVHGWSSPYDGKESWKGFNLQKSKGMKLQEKVSNDHGKGEE